MSGRLNGTKERAFEFKVSPTRPGRRGDSDGGRAPRPAKVQLSIFRQVNGGFSIAPRALIFLFIAARRNSDVARTASGRARRRRRDRLRHSERIGGHRDSARVTPRPDSDAGASEKNARARGADPKRLQSLAVRFTVTSSETGNFSRLRRPGSDPLRASRRVRGPRARRAGPPRAAAPPVRRRRTTPDPPALGLDYTSAPSRRGFSLFRVISPPARSRKSILDAVPLATRAGDSSSGIGGCNAAQDNKKIGSM